MALALAEAGGFRPGLAAIDRVIGAAAGAGAAAAGSAWSPRTDKVLIRRGSPLAIVPLLGGAATGALIGGGSLAAMVIGGAGGGGLAP